MRAVAITRFGEADALELMDLPAPEPGPGEVAIDVAYGGLNFAEVLFRRGIVDIELPYVPGIELSGHVRALGEGVKGLRVGEPVSALANIGGGGYGEVAVVPAELVVSIGDLDLRTAAAFPCNVTTAQLVLDTIARVDETQTVLIHAAAGGVGSVLGQVARALNAKLVIGTVSTPDKVDYARSRGFDEVILRDGFVDKVRELTGGRGVDVVVDAVGGPARRASLDALAPLGRVIVMGNASGAEDVAQPLNELWHRGRGFLGFNLRGLCQEDPAQVREAAVRALTLVERGQVEIDITAEYALADAADAHRAIESGKTRGKMVLRVAEPSAR